MRKTDQIRIERTLNAPTSLVWSAITDSKKMKQWYFAFGDDFRLEKGAIFEWKGLSDDCHEWLHRGELLEIIENKKLVHSWEYPSYSGKSIVTWDLIDLGNDKTQIILTHDFIEPFDTAIEALRKDNFVEGWNHIVHVGLVAFVEKNNL